MTADELRVYNRDKMRRWRANNYEHWLDYQRTYKKAARLADPEKHRAADRARYQRDGEQMRERNRGYRAAKQAVVTSFKDRSCTDCGNRFHPAAMHFDHLPERGIKRFDISHGGTRYSMAEVVAEIAKCEVVCANCHAIRSYRRQFGG